MFWHGGNLRERIPMMGKYRKSARRTPKDLVYFSRVHFWLLSSHDTFSQQVPVIRPSDRF